MILRLAVFMRLNNRLRITQIQKLRVVFHVRAVALEKGNQTAQSRLGEGSFIFLGLTRSWNLFYQVRQI
jgi:hypothetical protein